MTRCIRSYLRRGAIAVIGVAGLALLAAAPARAQEPLDFTREGSWETEGCCAIAIDRSTGPSGFQDTLYQLDVSADNGFVEGVDAYSTAGVLLREWTLKHPLRTALFAGIAVDSSTHDVYVAGRAFSPRRDLVARYGPTGDFRGIRQLPSNLGAITGVAVDPRTGLVYISTNAGRIFGFDFDTGIASVELSTGETLADIAIDPETGSGIGYAISRGSRVNGELRGQRLVRFASSGPPGTEGRLLDSVSARGFGLTVDNSNDVFVADGFRERNSGAIGAQVSKYSPALEPQGVVPFNGFAVPNDVAFDAAGALYVAAAPGGQQKILRYELRNACPLCAVLVDRPARFIADRSVSLSFATLGAGRGGPTAAQLGCQLDRRGKRNRRERRLGRWHECESPKRYKRLRPGRYTFTVRAFDAEGEPQPAKRVSFRVDSKAPRTRIANGPRGPIRRHRARFRVRSNEPGAQFACRLDRQPWERCSAPASKRGVRARRDWIRYRGLDRGRHVLRVRAIDEAGNRDPSPARRSFRVRGAGR